MQTTTTTLTATQAQQIKGAARNMSEAKLKDIMGRVTQKMFTAMDEGFGADVAEYKEIVGIYAAELNRKQSA